MKEKVLCKNCRHRRAISVDCMGFDGGTYNKCVKFKLPHRVDNVTGKTIYNGGDFGGDKYVSCGNVNRDGYCNDFEKNRFIDFLRRFVVSLMPLIPAAILVFIVFLCWFILGN